MKNKDKKRPICLNLYAIKDIKQPRYFPPYPAANDALAIRSFKAEVNGTGLVSANYEDFELWCLGDFDPLDGQIDTETDPIFICRASDVLETNNELDTQPVSS